MKKCIRCGIIKESIYFSKDKSRKSGLQKYCKECNKEEYFKNRDHVINRVKNNRLKNIEKVKETKAMYFQKNKNTIAYQKCKKYNSDVLFRLKILLGTSLRRAVKSNYWSKKRKTADIIGTDIKNLKQHIESQFKDGMSWGNHGKWHIDHIKPVASAKNIEELYKLFHYTNLQPLWAKENISKGAKYHEMHPQ